jgi:hypothetical protein
LDVRHAENIYKQMGKEGKILLTNTQMREVTIHAKDKHKQKERRHRMNKKTFFTKMIFIEKWNNTQC